MNLTELVDIVSSKTEQTKSKSREAVKTTLDTILREVKKGGRVTVVGFGAFYSTMRKARLGRYPQTGADVMIPATRVPRFRPGKEFKNALKKAK